MVSLIQSIFHGWGSGYVPDGLGFCLQNRGQLFALDPSHLNRLEPHKRPFHTIIPAFVTKAGQPVFSFGVMGGDFQPQGQSQVLMNLIDFGMSPAAGRRAAACRAHGEFHPHRLQNGRRRHRRLREGHPRRREAQARLHGPPRPPGRRRRSAATRASGARTTPCATSAAPTPAATAAPWAIDGGEIRSGEGILPALQGRSCSTRLALRDL